MFKAIGEWVAETFGSVKITQRDVEVGALNATIVAQDERIRYLEAQLADERAHHRNLLREITHLAMHKAITRGSPTDA
jgi:hypothetical protein